MTSNTETQPHRTGKSETIKYLVSGAVLAVGAGIFAWLYSLAQKPAEVPPTSLIPLVKTYDVAPYSGRLDRMVSGAVVPYREVRVSSEVAGRILKKFENCEVGHFVNEGDDLFQIDTKDWNLQLKTTEADIAQSEAIIKETEQDIINANALLQQVNQELELQKEDFENNERAKGALASSEYNAARRSLLAAEKQVLQAKNTLRSLEKQKLRLEASLQLTKTNLERIHWNIDRATVKATASGIIVREDAEEGDVIGIRDSLVTIEDTSRSEVLCNLSTTDLEWIRQNCPEAKATEIERVEDIYQLPKIKVKVFDRQIPGAYWEGVLDRFDGLGRDEVTKTFPVRIVVKNPIAKDDQGRQHALVRGMYVKCQMEVDTSATDERKFVSFPSIGLRPGNYVWSVENEKLKRVPVEVVDFIESADETQVIATVTDRMFPQLKVIISPLPQPSEDAQVELEAEQPKVDVAESLDDNEQAEGNSTAKLKSGRGQG